MTPNANTDYAELIERLDKQHILQTVLGQVTIDGKGFTIFDDAASALRALLAENARLVGEVEDMRRSTVGDIFRRIAELTTRTRHAETVISTLKDGFHDATVKVQECMAERDSLLAENARLVGEVEESWASANDVVGARDTKIVGFGGSSKALRDVLNNVQHGILCPAQDGWRDAGPCNCGLDAALTRSTEDEK